MANYIIMATFAEFHFNLTKKVRNCTLLCVDVINNKNALNNMK